MARSDPPEPSPWKSLADSGLIRGVGFSRKGAAGRTGMDRSPRVTVRFNADRATNQSGLADRCPSCPNPDEERAEGKIA